LHSQISVTISKPLEALPAAGAPPSV